MASELNTFISTLNVEFSRIQTCSYKLLLQDIAAEIATRKGTTPVDRRGVNATYTKEGNCPQTGVHTPDGKIYIGSYPRDKWSSDLVKPYHAEITANCNSSEGGGTNSTRNQKRTVNAVKRQKRKLKALKEKVKTAEAAVTAIASNDGSDSFDDEDTNQAGNNFGGKNLKKAKKVWNASKLRVKKIFRTMAKLYVADSKLPAVYDGRVEINSHVDTFVASRNCIPLQFTERVCDVMPYSDDYKAKEGVPIATVATGYTTANNDRYILIINEAIWLPELENSLANPNQFRDFGIEVQDNPYATQPMIIKSADEPFAACFRSQGTTIFMDSSTPTFKDLDEFPHIVLTSPSPWNPEDVQFPGLSNLEIEEIEQTVLTLRRVSGVSFADDNWVDVAGYYDPYLRPLRKFDIDAINSR